jgi:hypothetical protein
MGKVYAKELAALGDTYKWALTIPVDPLEEFVADAHSRPLLAVGSGGSVTAAHLATLLHRFHAGAFARHATPLDVLLSEPNLSEAAVLLLSASGKNRDVLAALERCIQHEARAVATLCMHRGSPLATTARRFERAYVFEEDAPSGKDGFLATNSLLATCVLIARAYGVGFPQTLSNDQSRPPLPNLSKLSTILVLHGGWGSPVATDLESKLNESAIVSAQLSDYRNFGHGRHLWLARRASETAIIAIVTPETSKLAERTCMLLPRDIPLVQVKTTYEGPIGTIDLLLQSFHLVGALGEFQSFDPGRPTVPEFGRKLYHLAPSVPHEDWPAPVMRKLARGHHFNRNQQEEVLSAFERFVKRLCMTKFGGIVLDYDGTLCGRAERFGVLRPELATECRRLLDAGLVIGIATGRGRSVRESLQKTLPRNLWPRVIIGYYNGGEIAPLEQHEAPPREAPPEPPLDVAQDLLERDSLLHGLVSFTVRRRQITIEPKRRTSTDALLAHVMTLLAPLEAQGVRVLVSSHSVDVLPLGVGKLAVVDEVKQRIREGTQVLCIGDRGAWPGNDFALLSHEPSLSVDEVSASLTTCWNIAPPGLSGADATLRYLQLIRIANGYATLHARDLWRVS